MQMALCPDLSTEGAMAWLSRLLCIFACDLTMCFYLSAAARVIFCRQESQSLAAHLTNPA